MKQTLFHSMSIRYLIYIKTFQLVTIILLIPPAATVNFTDDLFIMHFNLRSLQKHYDSMCEFLDMLPISPHII